MRGGSCTRDTGLVFHKIANVFGCKMKIQIVLLALALCFLTSLPALQAYYYGAGGCIGGQAAVGPPHYKSVPPTYNTQVISGSLPQGGFQIILNSKVLTPGSTVNVVAGKSNIIAIKAGTDKIFRGFLIRLGTTASKALQPLSGSKNVQVAAVCPSYGAVGLTHTLNTTKVGVSGYLDVSTVGKLPLDVTIVVQNRQHKSIFYHSGFTLNFIK